VWEKKKHDQKNLGRQPGTEKSTTSKSESMTPVPKHQSNRLNLTVGKQPEQGTGNRNQTERINVRSTSWLALPQNKKWIAREISQEQTPALEPIRSDHVPYLIQAIQQALEGRSRMRTEQKNKTDEELSSEAITQSTQQDAKINLSLKSTKITIEPQRSSPSLPHLIEN
jgi:hypothetical protein